MKSKFLLILIIAFSVSLLFSAFTLFPRLTPTTQAPAENEVNDELETQQEIQQESQQTEYEFTATENDVIALDLLESMAMVETQEFADAGKFVVSINGLSGNDQNYWAFYLNNEYAKQGASQTVLQAGDTIKFVYEAIEAY